MPDADPGRYVRGQYDGYREIHGVAADSDTETFVALRLEIDNWRWAGVPFFIRAGKALPVEATEVRVVFKAPPRLGIGGRMVPDPDELVLRIKPDPGAELCLLSKKPGRRGPAAGPPRPALRGPGRRPARALRAPAPRRAASATRICSRTRTRSRRPGGSSSRCSTTRRRSSPTSPAPGARRRQPPAHRPRRLAQALAAGITPATSSAPARISGPRLRRGHFSAPASGRAG